MSAEGLPCPWCGEIQGELWDYDWGTREVILAECSDCYRSIDIIRRVDVTYEIRRPPEPPPQASEGGEKK